jgi:hypothetical protein
VITCTRAINVSRFSRQKVNKSWVTQRNSEDFFVFSVIRSLTLSYIRNPEVCMLKKFLLIFASMALAASVSAQEAPADNSAPPPAPRRGGIPPCMRQAGVSVSTYEQLRSIAENARLEVVNACLNDSLNAQQRRQQLESIHVSAHQKMEELVTPAERRAFVACRQRHGERTNVEWFERPGGGCGARGGAASSPAPNENAPKQDEQNSSAPPSKDAAPQSN